MNGLDEDLTRGMLKAEKKLAKNHHNTSFLSALIKARSKLGYWRLWQTEIRTKRDLSEPRATLIEEIQWTDAPTFRQTPKLSQVRKELKWARKDIKNHVRNSKELREAHLEARAMYWANDNEEKAVKILANIRHSEASRNTFAKFKIATNKNNQGAITTIAIPDDPLDAESPHTTLFEPRAIIAALIARNLQHFSQAAGTPFTKPSILKAIGRNGEHGIEATKLLEFQEISKHTKLMIDELQAYQLPKIDITITAQDIKNGMKKWQEATSTSPSGRHFGHYKALLAPSNTKLEAAML